jgi:hypothetical protein
MHLPIWRIVLYVATAAAIIVILGVTLATMVK